MGAIVYVITTTAILMSAQFNISPHYSFMVQNQITVSLCLTITI